jgi:splicing factor 3B subunit 2
MGRVEIEVEKLRDAFFVHQHAAKPRLSGFGDLYYEGRELEKTFGTGAKPGALSARLREALGLPAGEDAPPCPPPWLLNMQRYGPPPSFPHLTLPGVNAPLPAGQSYGAGPGQWGRPPVDQMGRPLYGDVFGTAAAAAGHRTDSERQAGRRRLWGEFAAPSAGGGASGGAALSGQEAALVKRAGAGAEAEAEGIVLSAPATGAADEAPAAAASATEPASGEPADGTRSVASLAGASVVSGASGLDTPSVVDVRKGAEPGHKRASRFGSAMGADADATTSAAAAAGPKALYTVLTEMKTSLQGGLLGTTHGYVVPAPGAERGVAAPAASVGAASAAAVGGTAISLTPEELAGLSQDKLARKYEAELAAAKAAKASDGIAELFAEQERKQQQKQRKAEGGAGAKGGKGGAGKDFKF